MEVNTGKIESLNKSMESAKQKSAIIIHGSCDKEEYYSDQYPSLSNSHWFPWLQKQLLIKGYLAQTPEMPKPYEPNYEQWSKLFEIFAINNESTLIGYSCGAGFLIRWLSENKIHIDKLILVAPWMDPSRRETDTFFEFLTDPGLQDRVKAIHILISIDDDTEGVQETTESLLKSLPKTQLHQFKNMGHFHMGKMKTEKFPELLDIIIS